MTARILVVDDILANQRLLEAKLSAEYYEVITASNGLDALKIIDKENIDLVLLDVMMPGIDGIEACKILRSQVSTMHLPIIMVTALDTPEYRTRGLEVGADDFLSKPLNDVALFTRIRGLLRKRREINASVKNSANSAIELLRASSSNRTSIEAKVALICGDMVRTIALDHYAPGMTTIHNGDFTHKDISSFDVVVVDSDQSSFDALRVVAKLKAHSDVSVLLIVDPDMQQLLLRAIELGVDDYLVRPLDRLELKARIANQAWRRRYTKWIKNGALPSSGDFNSNQANDLDRHGGMQTIEAIASPMPFLKNGNTIDAGPDPYFDSQNPVSNLSNLVALQKSLVSTTLSSLPSQCPRSLVPALRFYQSELDATEGRILADVLKCMFEIARADIQAQSAEDEWLEEGTKKAFELFSTNHAKLLDGFPHSAQRDRIISEIKVDENLAVGRSITVPIENLQKTLSEADAARAFTDNFVKIVDSLAKHAHAVASHDIRVAESTASDDSISPKKRFILATLGFAERTYGILGTTAGLVAFVASPQGQAVMLRLTELISKFSRFLG